jgi:plastocyanin
MKTLLLIAGLALVAAAPANAVKYPKLTGTTGPGFTITLKKNGAKVKTLKAGKYEFALDDLSSGHNFDLLTPAGKTALSTTKKKVMTSVSAEGKSTFIVKLTPGTWRYVCDPHKSFMKGSFRVTS